MYWEKFMWEKVERLQSTGRLQSTVNLTLLSNQLQMQRGKGPREKWKEWEGQVVTFQGMKFLTFYNNKHYKLNL